MKLRSAKDASSLDAQCWISSVTGFTNLQSAEIQKTGLRSSESSGSWKGPERLALMFILHSFMLVGRQSSEILSISPYPIHSKEPPLVETTKSVSAITSTPQMESKDVVDYKHFYFTRQNICKTNWPTNDLLSGSGRLMMCWDSYFFAGHQVLWMKVNGVLSFSAGTSHLI